MHMRKIIASKKIARGHRHAGQNIHTSKLTFVEQERAQSDGVKKLACGHGYNRTECGHLCFSRDLHTVLDGTVVSENGPNNHEDVL